MSWLRSVSSRPNDQAKSGTVRINCFGPLASVAQAHQTETDEIGVPEWRHGFSAFVESLQVLQRSSMPLEPFRDLQSFSTRPVAATRVNED